MNTPPPENEFPKFNLEPSFSMPVLQPAQMDSSSAYKRRRHTLTRPDGALALLSDNSDEGETEDQVLDRISDALSNLIQEANDAVQNHAGTLSRSTTTIRQPRPTFLKPLPASGGSTSRSKSSLSTSRLPRPKARPSQQYHWIHDRHSSISSTASSGSLFSPAPIIESPITASSIEEKDYHPLVKERVNIESDNFTAHHYYDMEQHRRASTAGHTSSENPLMETFRRLDSSMALVDSLSRDLAQQEDETHSDNTYQPSKFTLLLLLPLLHIPHALITTVFDTIISPGTANTTVTWKSTFSPSFGNHSSSSLSSSPSPSISGIMAWSVFFALANIVITWSSVTIPLSTRRLSLPGSYRSDSTTPDLTHKLIRPQRPTPINTTLYIEKASKHRPTWKYSQQKPLTISCSNDPSYTTVIRESRLWQQDREKQYCPQRRYSL